MKREDAVKANELIDEQMRALDTVWESALEARDSAQRTLDRIGEMKRAALARRIANLRAATGESAPAR